MTIKELHGALVGFDEGAKNKALQELDLGFYSYDCEDDKYIYFRQRYTGAELRVRKNIVGAGEGRTNDNRIIK